MRDANDGVSLAAVVAKETTEGRWSGTGGGLGFGTGGIGLFFGGVSGSKQEQTARAKSFTPPPKSEFRIGRVIAPILVLMAVGLAVKFSTSLLPALAAAPSDAVGSPVFATISDAAPILGTAFLGVFLLALVLFAWFVLPRRWGDEEKRHQADVKLDQVRSEVYHRLRYVERDHVVFDPETGREAVAERAAIHALIDQIAAGDVEVSR